MAVREVEQRIREAVPEDFFRGVREAINVGFQTAHWQCARYSEGHRRNAIGQARHFACNEAFATLLTAQGFAHNGLVGANPIVGELNGVVVGRIHLPYGEFERARRGKARIEIASYNRWVAALTMPDLFDSNPDRSRLGMFIATAPHLDWELAMAPREIYVIVTDPKFEQAFYKQTLDHVVNLYAPPAEQQDRVVVRLKQVKKKGKDAE